MSRDVTVSGFSKVSVLFAGKMTHRSYQQLATKHVFERLPGHHRWTYYTIYELMSYFGMIYEALKKCGIP